MHSPYSPSLAPSDYQLGTRVSPTSLYDHFSYPFNESQNFIKIGTTVSEETREAILKITANKAYGNATISVPFILRETIFFSQLRVILEISI